MFVWDVLDSATVTGSRGMRFDVPMGAYIVLSTAGVWDVGLTDSDSCALKGRDFIRMCNFASCRTRIDVRYRHVCNSDSHTRQLELAPN